jgi:hypothetical protein
VTDYAAAMRALTEAVDDMNVPVKLTVGFVEAEVGTIKPGPDAAFDVADLLDAVAEQMRGVPR